MVLQFILMINNILTKEVLKMKYQSYTIPQSKKLQSALFWYHLFNSSESFLIKFCQNSLGIERGQL